MDNPTLNYETREGIQEGTDEFGKANLKMLLDFSAETIQQVTWLAALAYKQEMVETPVCDGVALVKTIHHQLQQEDEHFAELWAKSWEVVFPRVTQIWLEYSNGAHLTENNRGFWIDYEEAIAAYA